MKRTPLSIGSTIQAKGGSSYTYIIDCVIGDGASSIVYEAHYIDNAYGRHDVRLKECYPYAHDIQRIGTELVWADAESATNDKVAFTTAYHKLLDFQNTTKLRNSTAHIFDLCKANGTLYSVMDVNEGQTFEQDNSEKLSDILKTTLALAHVVEKYHNNGYLHLDIKPSNFLVIPETRELVILFDVDSVTSMEDIASGKVKCVSYSKGWAAPEQMQGRIDKLCPATDIYSIGAILFQKVMGRVVENEDIGIFADWDFDGEMFEKVNPKIKRLLRNIFRKTLAANTKRRYQSVDDLISALEVAVECVRDGAPYLISACPNPNKNFLGREKELADVAAAFNNGKKTVFLHGFGGIGKSELAKKYAQLHEKEYDSVLFLSYENSLEDLLNDIQIQNCDTETKNDNIKILKKIFADQRVLLIVDNFDVEIDSDDYLDTFLRLKVDKLFTTRTDFSDIADDKTQQINVENLNAKELASLFEKESGLLFSDEDRVVIDEILKNFDYYTLIVPILAKQLVSSGWSLETLREKSKQGLRAFEDTEKVAVAKDGRIYRKNGLDMMRATFRMVGLTDIQRRVLTNLYLLRFVKINKEEYRKYLWKASEKRAKHIDAINELVNRKWIEIKKPKDYFNSGEFPSSDPDITLHPIIAEMIEIELKPDITTSDISAYIEAYMPWRELEDHLLEGVDDWGQLMQDTLANKLNWFCALGAELDFSNSNNFDYIVEGLFRLINGNIFIDEIMDSSYKGKLFKKLEPFLENKNISSKTLFKLANIFEVKCARELNILHFGEDRHKKDREAIDTFQKYFFYAFSKIELINSNFKNTAILMLCKPVVQILSQYSSTFDEKITNDISKVILGYRDIWYNEFEKYDSMYDISDYLDELENDINANYDLFIRKRLNDMDNGDIQIKNPDKNTDGDLYYIKKYDLNCSIEDLVNELLQDNRFDNHKKNCIFNDMLNTVMGKIESFQDYSDVNACDSYSNFLGEVDWDRFISLANHFISFCHNDEFSEVNDIAYYIDMAEKYIAIAEAMQGNETKLIEYIDSITNNTLYILNEFEASVSVWKQLTLFWDLKNSSACFYFQYDVSCKHTIQYLANLLRNLRKSHLILSSLIRCSNALEEKIKRESDSLKIFALEENETPYSNTLKYDVNDLEDSASLLYNWYRAIAEFALNSAAEVFYSTSSRSDDSLKGIEYFDIFTQYFEKTRALLTTTAEIQDVANNDSLDIQFFRYQYSFERIADICKEYYFRKFLRGVDITEFISVLRSDNRLSEEDVFALCQKICDEVFFEIDRCWTVKGGLPAVKEYLDTYNWHNVEALLDFQEDLFVEQEKDDIDTDAVFVCDKYRAITYSILGNKENCEYYMGKMLKECKDELDQRRDRMPWYFYTLFLYDHPPTAVPTHFFQTFNLLMDIEKPEQALPYMVAYAEYVHEWLKTLPNYSELMMYGWYKAIATFALYADDDGRLYLKYQDKVDKMSEKDYDINLDNFKN